MSLNEVFNAGYERVQEKYLAEQLEYLRIVAEARNMPVEYIIAARGVFIPNDDFMYEVFGSEITQYDCYRDSLCVWNNAVIFPVRDVTNKVRGFAGFFPLDYLKKDEDVNYYAYSSQSVMEKGRFMYFPQGGISKAIDDGYLLIVDGLFDAISLCGNGYNAASLMGSNLTPEIIMQLRFIKKIIVPADNDNPGYLLYDKMKKRLSNVVLYQQGYTKDIDALLKTEHAADAKKALNSLIAPNGITMFKL